MRWRVIYLTGRDIYFEKGHNFVTNYLGDDILIMCTSPKCLVRHVSDACNAYGFKQIDDALGWKLSHPILSRQIGWHAELLMGLLLTVLVLMGSVLMGLVLLIFIILHRLT